MNREDMIRMALQAGMGYDEKPDVYTANIDDLTDFATLVAEHEREACAKVCEEEFDTGLMMAPVAPNLAAKIRARGDKHDI